MNYVMWTLLAIFIPSAVGVILYFILRDPIAVAPPELAVPDTRSRWPTQMRSGFVSPFNRIRFATVVPYLAAIDPSGNRANASGSCGQSPRRALRACCSRRRRC